MLKMQVMILFLSVTLLLVSIGDTAERRVRYMAFGRPHLEHNSKYIPYANMTSRKICSQINGQYLEVHFTTLLYFGNNVLVHFSFNKDLPNGHQRILIEKEIGMCDLLAKEFYGVALRQGKFLRTCPLKPGDYHLYNITIPYEAIPLNFPVFSGKIVFNVSKADTKEFVSGGWIEIEVKTIKIKA